MPILISDPDDWLNQKVSEALASVQKDGWVDGDLVLAEMSRWIAELDQVIAAESEGLSRPCPRT